MTKKVKIVIVGNGFGGVYTLKNLHKAFCGTNEVEIAMIGERNYFLFTPLLHEVATGGINPENIVEPIRKVLGCCIDDFYLGKAEDISLAKKTVRVGEKVLPYDYLVLAPGSETNFYDIPGAKENSLTLKSIEDAVRIKNKIIAQVEKASHEKDEQKRKKMLAFVIVGGGPTGTELAAEIYELIRENFSGYYGKGLIEDSSVMLIHKDTELLPQFGKKIRDKSLEFLLKKGIEIHLGNAVTEVGPDYIQTEERKIDTETIIWVAGIKPAELKFDREVSRADNGRIVVNEYTQLPNYPGVFALGDAASFQIKNSDKVLPAMAQVASKQGKGVAKNIYLAIKGRPLSPFKYRHTGSLISLGRWMAIGEIAGFTISGRFTWWLWRTVYLFKLISTRKKVEVAIDWTVYLFSTRDISEL